MLDDMDFHYNKVKCRKIEGMLPKLIKMVGGDEKYEINSMGKPSGTKNPAEKRKER